MNRRGFLARLSALTGVALVAPSVMQAEAPASAPFLKLYGVDMACEPDHHVTAATLRHIGHDEYELHTMTITGMAPHGGCVYLHLDGVRIDDMDPRLIAWKRSESLYGPTEYEWTVLKQFRYFNLEYVQ